MMLLLFGLLAVHGVVTCKGFSSYFHNLKAEFDDGYSSHYQNVDPGDPLYLTAYIKNGDIEHGKFIANVSTYWRKVIGYFN